MRFCRKPVPVADSSVGQPMQQSADTIRHKIVQLRKLQHQAVGPRLKALQGEVRKLQEQLIVLRRVS